MAENTWFGWRGWMLALLLLPALLGCRDNDDARPREVARIRAHLERVERELRAQTPTGLTSEQQERRAIVIDNLHAYIGAERYPINRTRNDVIPIFVDEDGVRCAMAALLEASGKSELVERVAATNDYAYIEELKDDPELLAWLTDNGITLVEAARIQPNYGPRPPPIPFDRGAAREALREACMAAAPCKDGSPVSTRHTVVFALDGHVTEVKHDHGPSAIAACVAKQYEKVKVPPFEGTPVAMDKTCSVGKPSKG